MTEEDVPPQASMGIITCFLIIGFLPFDLDPETDQDWIWVILLVILFIILAIYLFN